MNQYGVDVSHYNAIDWAHCTPDFVFQKCTESLNYVDPTFEKNRTACRAKGIPFGSYHFARGNDPLKEADYYLSKVGELETGEMLALDYEIHLPNPVTWCLAFLKEVETKTGIKPFLYINSSTASGFDWTPCIEYPLWIASYGINDGKEGNTPHTGKWPYFTIWQFTSNGSVSGVAGRVDRDVFPGTKEGLAELGKKAIEIPEIPTPPPTMPQEPPIVETPVVTPPTESPQPSPVKTVERTWWEIIIDFLNQFLILK